MFNFLPIWLPTFLKIYTIRSLFQLSYKDLSQPKIFCSLFQLLCTKFWILKLVFNVPRSTLTTGVRVIGAIYRREIIPLFSLSHYIHWVWDFSLLFDWLIDNYYTASSSTDSKSMSLNWRNHMQMIQICFIFDQGSLFFTDTISTDLNLKLIQILWKCPRSCFLLKYPGLFSSICSFVNIQLAWISYLFNRHMCHSLEKFWILTTFS